MFVVFFHRMRRKQIVINCSTILSYIIIVHFRSIELKKKPHQIAFYLIIFIWPSFFLIKLIILYYNDPQ